MTAATVASASDGPLTPEHRHELTLAEGRAKKVRTAAGVAGFNGWATGFCAVLSAPFALFSIIGFVVTVGLSIVAYNEFRGRKRLLRFNPTSPALLGWNQVGLLTLIIVYCGWMLVEGLTGPGLFSAELKAKPELAAALGPVGQWDDLYKMIVVAVYGTVIVLTAIFQGLNAAYYFTRRKHVEAYVRETPKWVLDLQRLDFTRVA